LSFIIKNFTNINDAADALYADDKACFYSGGTIIMRKVNEADQSFKTIIKLDKSHLKEIKVDGGNFLIGSGVTMDKIISHPDLGFLKEVARSIGGPAIRCAATLGGNLFANNPYGDFSCALMALRAKLNFAGNTLSSLTIDEFMKNRDNFRRHIITSITFERLQNLSDFSFLKITRTLPKGISLITIATNLVRSGAQIISPRIVYGNMTERTPIRDDSVEKILEGQRYSEDLIEKAVGSALNGIETRTDGLASEWYRRKITPVYLKRSLMRK